jgi:hypothetical protein
LPPRSNRRLTRVSGCIVGHFGAVTQMRPTVVVEAGEVLGGRRRVAWLTEAASNGPVQPGTRRLAVIGPPPVATNCYAMTLSKRLKAMGSAKYQSDGDHATSGPGSLLRKG